MCNFCSTFAAAKVFRYNRTLVKNMDISIIVPLFNEAESLPKLYEWIARVMKENKFSYEVIFVNDGSTDDSWDVITNLKSQISNRMTRSSVVFVSVATMVRVRRCTAVSRQRRAMWLSPWMLTCRIARMRSPSSIG